MFEMAECNMYPNLCATLSNEQQLKLKKSMKLKIILLLKLKKED